MLNFLRRKLNKKGFSLAEVLIVVAILLVLMCVAAPNLIKMQKDLRQKELDSKAGIIYTAVQNRLTKMRAGGDTAIYQLDEADDGTHANGVLWVGDDGYPGDFDPDEIADTDNLENYRIAYFTSSKLSDPNSAAYAIMGKDTLDPSLLNNNWVIEFNPKNASVYAVFYSETNDESDKNNAAKGYASYFNTYNNEYRYKSGRYEGGARVGYYGGANNAGDIGTKKVLSPNITITNDEKLTAYITCKRPAGVTAPLAILVTIADNEGNSYGHVYEWGDSGAGSIPALRDYSRMDLTHSSQGDPINAEGSQTGIQFAISLTLDDLTESKLRFNNLYGAGSGHGSGKELVCGTDFTISVIAYCPKDSEVVPNEDKDKIVTASSNSLYAYEPATSFDSGIGHNTKAVILKGRHLQNLDESAYPTTSGNINPTTYITKAIQSKELDLGAGSTWASTYSSGYFNGTTTPKYGLAQAVPNFKPIKNRYLTDYHSSQAGTLENISGLTENLDTAVNKGDGNGGLFEGSDLGNFSIKDIVLKDANITSASGSAGAFFGSVTGTVIIENCRSILDNPTPNSTGVPKIGIDALNAGGLVGSLNGGNLTITKSLASSVENSLTESGTDGSSGGLVGRVTGGDVRIDNSYADNYMIGAYTGGLVGRVTGGSVSSITNAYAAGFRAATTQAAGLVCGAAGSISGSYTVLSKLNTVNTEGTNYDNAVYYSTAVSAASALDVYFLTASSGSGTGEISGTAAVGSVILADALKNSGYNFNTIADTSGITHKYNLINNGLTTSYPYPVLTTITEETTAVPVHYGDWAADFEEGALVYYEKYSDGTYGFYGANASYLKNCDSSASIVTDDRLKAVGDGYGIIYSISGAQTSIGVRIKNGDTEIFSSSNLAQDNGGAVYEVTIEDGTKYEIYPFPSEWVNTTQCNNTTYYLNVELTEGGKTRNYYFNPHYAKTVSESPSLLEISEIYLRTARQLNNLSLYYSGYRTVIKNNGLTFKQENNLDYKEYEWSDYGRGGETVTEQRPIGASQGESFNTTYDGGCNWITNINFVSEGNYVGLFGYVDGAGTIENAVLKMNFTPVTGEDSGAEDSEDNYYIKRDKDITSEDVYMGVMAGFNAGVITNSAASGYFISGSDGTIHAYTNSNLSAGGFVGCNSGTITNCSEDCPQIRISTNYANAYVGGFVGSNQYGTIRNSYAMGYIQVIESKGGEVNVSGFAGANTGRISSSYCGTAIESSGDAGTYGFAQIGGSVSGCEYLCHGSFKYVGELYAYNAEGSTQGNDTSFDALCKDGNSDTLTYSYGISYEDNVTIYPYRPVVTNILGKYVHYGDWQHKVELGDIGMFYWEHEEGGTNDGYHMTYIGTTVKTSTTDKDAKISSGTTLCNSHNDGGRITSYGYGYYRAAPDTVTDEEKRKLIEKTGISGTQGINISYHANIGDAANLYNTDASDALKTQMGGQFEFYAYTTRKWDEAGGADYIYLDDYSFNISDNACSPDTSSDVTKLTKDGYGKVTLSDGTNTYEFMISPFFANAMGYAAGVGKTGIVLTGNDGTKTDYSKRPGLTSDSNANAYEIRSATQLQYINWNRSTGTVTEWLNYADYVNNGMNAPEKWSAFTYLGYAEKTTSGSQAKYYFNQTHDINADMAVNAGTTAGGGLFTPIGSFCELKVNASTSDNAALVCVAYFNGTYNGNSYQIKNVEICSRSQGVGLFGIAISADIQNIILYSDKGNKIQTASNSMVYASDGANRNWYCLGGLAGVAAVGNSSTGGNAIFKNCTVSGYTIRDNRNACGYGGTNMGGFVGLTNVGISACSAVTDIEIYPSYNNSSRNVRVGGLAGNFRGSVLENCYSGGSISSTLSDNTRIHVNGLVGGWYVRANGNLADGSGLFGSLTKKPIVKNCYTYTDLSGCTGKSIKTLRPVAAKTGEKDAGDPTISNCYYYTAQDITYKLNNNNSSLNIDGQPAQAVRVKYAQLSGAANLTAGTYNGRNILTALNAGAASPSWGTDHPNTVVTNGVAAASPPWGTVTVTEGSGNTRIDGKYSFPGSNIALEGQNYPFPTVLLQKDLSFSTSKAPIYVYVHYGEWPTTGTYWAKSRANMDIFADMTDQTSITGSETVYAEKDFTLMNAGSLVLNKDSFDFSPAGIAEFVSVRTEGSDCVLTVRALKRGSVRITANTGTGSVFFDLAITANLTAPGDITLGVPLDKTNTLKLTATDTAGNDYSERLTWSLANLDPNYLEQVSQDKNKFEIKRFALGDQTLEAVWSYDYHSGAGGEVYSGRVYNITINETAPAETPAAQTPEPST
ncbi:MAG: prepilin-type N-terminal cleavage/methylation domain-containing protein, partial [Eubacteriales bacterium]|nr:prepilin-type N-terminal cleavage/methylation domain-containing protein [Eubacteriales bacterium]